MMYFDPFFLLFKETNTKPAESFWRPATTIRARARSIRALGTSLPYRNPHTLLYHTTYSLTRHITCLLSLHTGVWQINIYLLCLQSSHTSKCSASAIFHTSNVRRFVEFRDEKTRRFKYMLFNVIRFIVIYMHPVLQDWKDQLMIFAECSSNYKLQTI